MTRHQQMLAIWGGGALVVLIVAGVILSGRADRLATARAEAERLHGAYQRLYPAEGRPSREALDAGKRLRDHQAQALKEAEEALIATLPDDYRRTDVNQTGSRLSADLASLRQRAQRQKVALPAQLPFERGFDSDEAKRSLQLAQLYVYRTLLDLSMDSGVTRVSEVREGVPYRNASSTYAVLPCEIGVDGNYEAIVQLIDTLRARHEGGFGVRDLKLVQGPQGVQATILATFLTLHDPAWDLHPISGVPARVGTIPASDAGGRRPRLGGG